MKNVHRTLALGIFAFAVCGAASAQSRGSFYDVDAITDLQVITSNGGLTYEIDLGPNPTVDFGGNTYHVTDLVGFWALSDDDDLSSSASNQNGWQVNTNNSGPGGIAGWKTNPNSGINPGESITFTFNSLSVSSVEHVGYHMRFAENFGTTGANTASVTLNPVPEPASIAALAIGALGLLRRRNRR